jgi:PQQ-dependent catabolism-associated CXXCW motif protein
MTLPGAHVIATSELVGLLQRNAAIAIDALSGTPHPTLPNAVWIPQAGAAGTFRDATQLGLGRVLANITSGNQSQALVFFCEGAECWLSYNAALRALNLGYRNVYWYRGGLEAWHEAGLPTGAPAAVF